MIEGLIEPYRARRTWPIGIETILGWQLKVYGITPDGADIPSKVCSAAFGYVRDNVAWPVEEVPKYGFITIHTGEENVWLLVDLWVNDIMRHFLFCAPLATPTEFGPPPPGGLCACVWELEVTKHERDAWVRHYLSCPQTPDFSGYLSDTIEWDAGT
jgi:hypothetical protein